MRNRHTTSPAIRQKLTLMRVMITGFTAIIITCISALIMHLKHPERAMAAACEVNYILNWNDPLTYKITGGKVNSSQWTVTGNTYNFYSPVWFARGNVGDRDRVADLSLKISQSENLDRNDTAQVNIYSNGIIVDSYTLVGNDSASEKTIRLALNISAGTHFRIGIKLKNDKSNESWNIKNGDLTCCLKAHVTEPSF